MILFTKIVCVSWNAALQVDKVWSLISSSNSLNLHTSSYFYLVSRLVFNLVSCDKQLVTELFHHLMELWRVVDFVLIVHWSIFCEGCHVTVVQDSWDDWLREHSLSTVLNDGSSDEIETVDFSHLKRLKPSQIMVSLGPTWRVLGAWHIAEVFHLVNQVTEEDWIKDVDLCFLCLVWIDRSDTSLDNCLYTFDSCLTEITVDLVVSSISLCSLNDVVLWEVFHNLVFLVPVSCSLRVDAVKRVQELTDFFKLTFNLKLWVLKSNPWLHWHDWVHQNSWLGSHDFVDVFFKALTKLWWDLIYTTDERITECRVALSMGSFPHTGRWVECRPFWIVVDIESIHTGSDSPLANVKCFDCDIEQISLLLTISWNWIELWKLDRFNAFWVLYLLWFDYWLCECIVLQVINAMNSLTKWHMLNWLRCLI